MSRGDMPIVMCDHEDGCMEWFVDQFTIGAMNWEALTPKGWTYDPYKDTYDLCPEHSNPEEEE